MSGASPPSCPVVIRLRSWANSTVWCSIETLGFASGRSRPEAAFLRPSVGAVYAYPQQESVAVRFGGTGKATTVDLIAALKMAGFDAAPF